MQSGKYEGNSAIVKTATISLDQQLKPALPEQALDAIQVLFASMPSANAGEDTKLKVQAYLLALREFVPNSIKAVVSDFLSGRTDCDPRFVPTPPQLAQLCRDKEAEALRKRAPKLTAIPEPVQEISAEEAERRARKVERCKAIFEATAAGMSMDEALKLKPATDEEIAAIRKTA